MFPSFHFLFHPKLFCALLGFRIRLFNLFIKVLSCILYCVRVVNDNGNLPRYIKPHYYPPGEIKYQYLIWVDRKFSIWICQVIVAFLSILQTIIIFFLSYKGSAFRVVLKLHFLLELITSMPLIATIFVPLGRKLYVPIFLNCWLAKSVLQTIMHDSNRISTSVGRSALIRQMVILFSTLLCLVFTGTCGIEHLQRSGERRFDLFTSFYFVMVTFSTVGYGDWYPDTWMSRLFVVVLICIAFAILPKQIEALGQTYMEGQKAGGEYAESWASNEKHVVVTVTHLEAQFILDFLSEFYAYPEHQNYLVILLSPCEMDDRMRMLLKIPMWSTRVLYIRGSALKDDDLERAKMGNAKACFILSARHIYQKTKTDEHTVLRSWAVKDFAPHVPQYVQIFRPETKMHIEHAEFVVCEDEFKYSLLANNCICPGISTFITLLMHTSRGEEGQKSTEPWHKVYGFHSGNEIYDIKVAHSQFFSEYIGKSFTYASFHAYQTYGVGLIAIKSEGPSEKIRLNPGQYYYLNPADTAYYMALTNEESLYDFRKGLNAQRQKATSAAAVANIGTMTLDIHQIEENNLKTRKRRKQFSLTKKKDVDEASRLLNVNETFDRKSSIGEVLETTAEPDEFDVESQLCTICACHEECIARKTEKTYPPLVSYIDTGFTVCHILKEKRLTCCLEIASACEHCPFRTANEYNWKNPAVIVAADRTCSGLPNPSFLDVIAWFPLVYWMQGKISSLDNLLKAGVCQADNVVVVKEGATSVEEHLADCTTIITVQKIHKMFPRLRIITELTHVSNMRFMQFDADDQYALQQSKYEKKERKRGSSMPYMFRLPFAQGGVFSANMLDRLLYQAHVKNYVVDFIRLLLGIDQSKGSGYLTSFKITSDDLWIGTYGRLYQKLCASVADIPIGIYRTMLMDAKVKLKIAKDDMKKERRKIDKVTISDLVHCRMQKLGIPREDYEYDEKLGTVSYVIINPSLDITLEAGDIVYVIKAPISEDAANHQRTDPRRGLQRQKFGTQTPPPNVTLEEGSKRKEGS
uniref:Potassium channel subfamily T member 1 n=1 Tax=Elaeophora elaphi TaxID=1147741 RepID=A0A158Q6W7_9BILA